LNTERAAPRSDGSRPPGGLAVRFKALAVFAPLALLAGCRDDMYDQPKYKPYAASTFFPDGKSARALEPGTVSREDRRNDELLTTGKVNGKDADVFPFPIDRQSLERGRQRYMIYCSPCHGASGDGRGMIVQRGFSPPPPFYGKRDLKAPSGPVTVYDDLRKAPVGHYFGVMTNGHGAMYSYASRISIEDRWKIAAYIRALQLSQHATADDLKAIPDPTPDERRLLQELSR
jgi:mono/diheme cytochrome c family protein